MIAPPQTVIFRLNAQAKCADAPPHLFDVSRLEDAEPALEYCRGCPVIAECLDVVNPQVSGYDGVAGGMVWSRGSRVRAPKRKWERRRL